MKPGEFIENVKAVLIVLAICFIVFPIIGMLAGCGGSDEEEPAVTTPRVDCKSNPERCA